MEAVLLMVAESPVTMELHLEGTGLLMQVFIVKFHHLKYDLDRLHLNVLL